MKNSFIKTAKTLPIFIVIQLFFSHLYAQSSLPGATDIPEDRSKIGYCGTTCAMVEKMLGLESKIPVTDNPTFRSIDNFHTSSVVVCGHFNIYYDDFNFTPLGGFADPVSGNDRQATLCAVLQYVESVIDLSQLTDNIDLFVSRSFSAASLNYAPVGTTYLAMAGPFFHNAAYASGTPGFYGGDVFEHIQNGSDLYTGPTQYDAFMQVNFDQAYTPSGAVPINYWNYYTPQTPSCCWDLFSVLLHEVTHTLGWLSFAEESSAANHPIITTNGRRFTLYDRNFLYYGDILTSTFTKVVDNSSINIDGTINANNDPARSCKIWMNNQSTPNNHPAYGGDFWGYSSTAPQPNAIGSLFNHMYDAFFSFTRMSQYSPGSQQTYVMGYEIAREQYKRTYTLFEIRSLLQIGYGLDPTFASSSSLNGVESNLSLLQNNHPVSRTNQVQVTEEAQWSATTIGFADCMGADYSIATNSNTPTNLTATQITIPSSALGTDADPGDVVTIIPATVFNIRGCGNGGNNSNQLQITPSSIIFTPRPGFYGRAQFGCYLTDGRELGAFRVVTIDVQAVGSAYTSTLTFGHEKVLNGTFEEGTETRQRLFNESKFYSGMNYYNEGLFMIGDHYPDNESAFSIESSNWNYSGGILIHNSWKECDFVNGGLQGNYGGYGGDFNTEGYIPPGSWPVNVLPNNATNPNERYSNLNYLNFFSLVTPVSNCHTYRLQLDLNFQHTTYSVNSTYTFTVNFITPPSCPVGSYTTYQSIAVPVTVTANSNNTWQHVSVDINYCSANPASVMLFTSPSGLADRVTVMDNVSLTEITSPPLTVAASGPTQLCYNSTATLTATPSGSLCTNTYTWMPGNLTGNPVTVGPVTATTTYTVTLNDGCRTATNTVTVTPSTVPTITAAGPFCVNDNTGHQIIASPTSSFSFWTGTGISSTGVFTPSTAGSGTFVVTYHYVPFAGCTTLVNTNIIVSPNFSIVFGTNGPFCSTQGPQSLSVQPTGGTWSGPGVTANQFSPSVTGTGTFILTYSVTIGGCTNSATTSVIVNPPPAITITPVGPLCSYDPAVVLSASPAGGTFTGSGVYFQGGLYHFNPATTGPGTFTVTYSITSPCPNSGTMQIVVNPGVGPASWPKFISGSSSRSFFNSIVADGQGNIYATGEIGGVSTIPSFGTYTGNYILVLKYNEMCGGVWIRLIASGPGGYDITLDNNGDVLVTGGFIGTNVDFGNSQFLSTVTGVPESFLLKLDKTTGNTIYAKQSTSPVSGSPSSAIGKAIRYDAVNNAIYVSGDFENTIQFGSLTSIISSGNRDVFVTRYNTAGTEVWSTKIASAFATKPDIAGGIGTDASGNLYVGCSVSGSVVAPVAATNTTAGTTDLFMVKLSPATGAYAGANVIRGNSTNDVFLKDLFVDPSGRCYITGAYKGALTLGSALATAATEDIYVGWTSSTLSFTGTWSYACGSTNAAGTLESGNSITVYNNDVYFTGITYSGATFTGFTPSSITSIAGGYEVFVARVLNGGTRNFLEYSTTTANPAKNMGLGITVSPYSGSIFTAGSLAIFTAGTPSVTFNGPSLQPLTGYQGFIARSNTSTFFRMGIPENEDQVETAASTTENTLSVFPNPTTGLLTLSFNAKPSSSVLVTVTDISGRIVKSALYEADQSGQIQLDLGNCENGLYLLNVDDGQVRTTKRIVVQR